MSLLIRARWKATKHIAANWRDWRNHRIWRLYQCWGLETLAIGCECGKIFGYSCPLDAEKLSTWIRWRKLAKAKRR